MHCVICTCINLGLPLYSIENISLSYLKCIYLIIFIFDVLEHNKRTLATTNHFNGRRFGNEFQRRILIKSDFYRKKLKLKAKYFERKLILMQERNDILNSLCFTLSSYIDINDTLN